jgi:methane/ammonia monooxygenase subunit C
MADIAIGQKSAVKAKTGFLNIPAMAAAVVSICVLFAAARFYQQAFAWEYGLDSRAPEFETYWMNVFYAEVAIVIVASMVLWSWLWMTREKDVSKIAPREELRRQFNMVIWLLSYALILYFDASFLGEQDAAWHQTVIRDTSFTPSHIFVFYLGMPVFIMVGVGALLYAHTRIPQYQGRISVPFVIAIAGPFFVLPNVGYNEWGHTFWLMEEYFTAPLHYGFVVFGWTALALGGILIQQVNRVGQLLRVQSDPEMVNYD